MPLLEAALGTTIGFLIAFSQFSSESGPAQSWRTPGKSPLFKYSPDFSSSRAQPACLHFGCEEDRLENPANSAGNLQSTADISEPKSSLPPASQQLPFSYFCKQQ
ncbi:MAG: hypothetical protein JXB85_14745 [Anaerolineales bacterium]|nr:hypothetical protein [Anaerolineales bacterium]